MTLLLRLAKCRLAGGLVSPIAATRDMLPPKKPAQNGIKPPSRLAVRKHSTPPRQAIKHSTTITACLVPKDRRDIRLPSQAFAPARAATPAAPSAKAGACWSSCSAELAEVADHAEGPSSMATTQIRPQMEAWNYRSPRA